MGVNVSYALVWFIMGMLLFSAMAMTQQILFALAAYYDARAKGNSSPVMWGLLIGFLGLIPGIIYLCIRNTAPKIIYCTRCGIGYQPTVPECPQCGNRNNYVAENYQAVKDAARAKKLLIAACIVLGVAIIGFIVCIGVFIAWMAPAGIYYSGY